MKRGKPGLGLAFVLRLVSSLAFLLGVGGLGWFGAWVGWGSLLPRLDPVWRGLASFGVAFVAMFLAGWIVGRIMRRQRPDVFGLFNEAFLKISQGDYRVEIPVGVMKHGGGGPGDTFKIMAQNLNTMAGALARMEELRKQFVADVSHEFQSPLTSILGFAQALKPGDVSEELRQRYLDIIEAEARRLSRVSANLLKLNALEDREAPPDPTTFRLDTQLRQVIVNLEPQWSAKGLAVEAELAEVELTGNQELWTQAWTNLVHNAVKFTPSGGTVTVRIVPGPPMAVEVEDTGIGLAPGEAERVFERFYKADSARSSGDANSGSGLGLALVQRIAALHGAHVEALSPGPGAGTTLRVTFEAPQSRNGETSLTGSLP